MLTLVLMHVTVPQKHRKNSISTKIFNCCFYVSGVFYARVFEMFLKANFIKKKKKNSTQGVVESLLFTKK